ncbi:MAG: amidohydrolase, partial [Planctomycetota bacterium]|nr:amidohydrolase [Planctomycetota bacterium]
MNTEEQIRRVRALVAEELPALVEFRHDLHRNPELGYEEFRTSQVVTEGLAASNVAYVDSLAGGTGVLG